MLFKAAHLESRQLQYQKPTLRLADRATYAQLSEEVMKVKHLANEKHKSIGILNSSGDVLKQKISDHRQKGKPCWQNSNKWKKLCPKLNRKKASCLKRSRLLNKSETSKPARHCR